MPCDLASLNALRVSPAFPSNEHAVIQQLQTAGLIDLFCLGEPEKLGLVCVG